MTTEILHLTPKEIIATLEDFLEKTSGEEREKIQRLLELWREPQEVKE